MIRLEAVTKTFPEAARPAVDSLDLEVPEGTICVLIGPSGCGKTTTMRMVNRLIEPTFGRVLVGGEDVSGADPVRLRRTIGYVIQQVGLFPHMSVAENVATVPGLLGWPKPRIAARVEEMLALVGLDPREFARRFPGELSGGQRQRVGVARALAADPPVMLMDEPFGAVDPVVRERLQSEFLANRRGDPDGRPAGADARRTVLFGPVKMKRYARKSVPETMEGEVSRFYFHCSDGLDLVVDREGIEVQGSDGCGGLSGLRRA
jgi:ABC-type proline/glycine betaine transport system ATPase subunit